MKTVRSSLFALVCAAFVSANAAALDVGEPAPSFALPTTAGDTVRLEQLRGKAVYVDFWEIGRASCRERV